MNLTQKDWWTLVICWIFVIYATLYIAPSITESLREVIPFHTTLNVALTSSLIGLAVLVWKQAKTLRWSTMISLAGILTVYFYFISTMRIAEEKIHFIEYGVLAFLLYQALKFKFKGLPLYATAFVLTIAFGWIDEGIQYLLPNRYYQLRDVLLNVLSGGLGLMWTGLLEREKRFKEKL